MKTTKKATLPSAQGALPAGATELEAPHKKEALVAAGQQAGFVGPGAG